MRSARLCVLFSVVQALLLVSGPAHGHGEIKSTIPKANSTVKKLPNHIAVQFTEAPTKDAVLKVTDGCQESVAESVIVSGDTAHITLEEGHPGRFVVSYRVISTVDGHPSEGDFSFRVAGPPGCSQDDVPANGKEDGKDDGAGADDAAAGPSEPASDESSFPVVPATVGVVVLLSLAFLVRRAVSART